MADEKIIPSDDYRVKVATVVDMADKWFRQADGGELDKYDEIELLDACESVLKFCGLRVVDPAKCMVLERQTDYPTTPGKYLVMPTNTKGPGWTVDVFHEGNLLVYDDEQNTYSHSWKEYADKHCLGVCPRIFKLPEAKG